MEEPAGSLGGTALVPLLLVFLVVLRDRRAAGLDPLAEAIDPVAVMGPGDEGRGIGPGRVVPRRIRSPKTQRSTAKPGGWPAERATTWMGSEDRPTFGSLFFSTAH